MRMSASARASARSEADDALSKLPKVDVGRGSAGAGGEGSVKPFQFVGSGGNGGVSQSSGRPLRAGAPAMSFRRSPKTSPVLAATTGGGFGALAKSRSEDSA